MAEGEPTRVIASNIADNAPYTKTRADERFISTRQENLVLDSGAEYVVLDEMESGELQSVRVVVDNPYVQVLLQLDEYRNKDPDGESAAEIIYNGNSDTANRGFKVMDGQGSGKGYVMEYRPDVPESYKGRVRLVIRNQIKPSASVYGMGLSYTSRGSLANPAVPAHMAGGTFSHPALRSADLAQIAQIMTKPVGVEGYSSNQVFNEAIIFSDNPIGSDHPYQGIAGKPTFTKDVTSENIFEIASFISGSHNQSVMEGVHGHYRLVVLDEPDAFPGTSNSPSTMKIMIEFRASWSGNATANATTMNSGLASVPWHVKSTVRTTDLQSKGPFNDTYPGTDTYTPFTGGTSLTGATLPSAETWIGKRMFFRRGGTVYFPGVIKSITKAIPALAGLKLTTGSNDFTIHDSADGSTDLGLGYNLDTDFDASTNDAPVKTGLYTTGSGAAQLPYAVCNYFPGWTDAIQTELSGTIDTVTGSGTDADPWTAQVTVASTAGLVAGMCIVQQTAGTGTFWGTAKPWSLLITSVDDATTFTFKSVADTGTTIPVAGTVTDFDVGLNSGLPRTANSGHRLEQHNDSDYKFLAGTPWTYIIEFEPGVTNSPIDFGAIPEASDLPGADGYASFSVPYHSTGGFSDGVSPATDENCWGYVTSQADDNPHVLIKEIEVKRAKKVSFDG